MLPIIILKKVLGLLKPLIQIAVIVVLILLAFEMGLGIYLPFDSPLVVGTATADTGGQIASAGVPSSMSAVGYAQQDTPQEDESQSVQDILDNMTADRMAELVQTSMDETTEAEWRAVIIYDATQAWNPSEEDQAAFESFVERGEDEFGVSQEEVLAEYESSDSEESSTSTATPEQTETPSESANSSSDDSENSSSVWDGELKRLSEDATITAVEFENGQAIVYILYEGSGSPSVQVSDATRKYTGDIDKDVDSLKQGKNKFRVTMANPSEEAVTVDMEGGDFWLYNEPPKTNILPDVAFGLAVLLMGMFATNGLLIGIERFTNRRSRGVKREM